MFYVYTAHLGCPGQNPPSRKMVVCVCVCVCVRAPGRQGSLALAGSLSRRRKTLIQNQGWRSPLASSGTSATLSTHTQHTHTHTHTHRHTALRTSCILSGTTCVSRLPSVLWCCWLDDRKGIQNVKKTVVGAGMVICLGRCADLHIDELIPLRLTVSCYRKFTLVLFYLSGTGSPR